MSVILLSSAMATFSTGLMLGFRATIMSLSRASERPSRRGLGKVVG